MRRDGLEARPTEEEEEGAGRMRMPGFLRRMGGKDAVVWDTF